MKSRINKKRILIIILTFILLFILTENIYATDDIMQGAKNFINAGNRVSMERKEILETSNNIYNTFLAVGSAIVVVVGAIIGVELITGTAEDKAKAKEKLIAFAIGAVVIYGAYGIWKALSVTFLKLF